MKFKVGDRVIVISNVAFWPNYARKGWTGTIVKGSSTDSDQLVIEWDKKFDSGGGNLVFISQIQKIEEKKQIKEFEVSKFLRSLNGIQV